jgi:exodeoxyribonuclease VII small subunit
VQRVSTSDADAPTPVSDLSYEQARDELVRLVARIESGQVPLEESMALWERGEELAAHCQAKLDAAQDTLDRATGQGEPVAAPAQDEARDASQGAAANDRTDETENPDEDG